MNVVFFFFINIDIFWFINDEFSSIFNVVVICVFKLIVVIVNDIVNGVGFYVIVKNKVVIICIDVVDVFFING